MAIRTSCVVLVFSTLSAAGCGTVANLAHSRPEDGGRVPFGGVKHDVWCIQNAANGEFGVRTHDGSEPKRYPQTLVAVACAADLPLSLIGDIVTWPYVAAYSFVNEPIPVPPVIQAPAPVPAPSLTPAPTGRPPVAPPVPLPTPATLP
jgi:uncharacterized protein YceK